VDCTNYLAYLLTHCELQSHPSPIGHGWHLVNGLCVPVHSTHSPLLSFMPLPTKPEAEINSDDGGQNKEIDSDSCSSYTDSDSESSSDSEAADMY